MLRLGAVGLALAVALAAGDALGDGRLRVDVVVADAGDPEAMAFWVARGAGFFEAEGVEVQIATPEVPAGAIELWQSRHLAAAVLGPDELVALARGSGSGALVAEIFDHGELHALCFDRVYANRHPEAARGMTRAIYRAERLIHADPRAATNALLMAFPATDRRRIEESLRMYAPRVPPDPRISADDLRVLLAPDAGASAPDQATATVATLVMSAFADDAVGAVTPRPRKATPPERPTSANLAGRVAALTGFVGVLLAWMVVTLRRRARRR